MSARNFNETFGAGETKRLPAGRYFFIRTATGPLDIKGRGNTGAPLSFLGIGAGTKFGPLPEGQQWSGLDVTSASAQAVEIIISDDGLFEVASNVTVSGAVNTTDTPSTTLTSPATATRATGGADTVAANLSRRRITIQALSTNTGSLYVQAVAAGAGRGLELQPGLSIELRTTASFDIHNSSGANQSYNLFEES